MKTSKDIPKNSASKINKQEPHHRFPHVFLISNLFVVGLMIGVTFLVERVHQQALATVDKKEETTKIMKVAAIGDSITRGSSQEGRAREGNSYPTQLQSLLGDKYEVYNYGLSGRTLLSTGDQPYTVEGVYKQSQVVHPDIVLIMLGTNDSKGINWDAQAYDTELSALVNSYKNLANKPKVYLMTTPPVFNNHTELSPNDFNKSTITNQIVPTVRRVAKATNVSLIDIYQAMNGRSSLFPDGVHPSLSGNKLIAETVHKAIKYGVSEPHGRT